MLELLPHQESFFAAFIERHDIRGRDVLELGGAMPATLVLEKHQAKSWTCLQSTSYAMHRDDNQQPSQAVDHANYQIVWRNAEDFLESTHDTWDYIFSIAAFEHFLCLPKVARVLPKVLRPGGYLFTIFAPIWSGPWGNHFSHAVPTRFGWPAGSNSKTWTTQDIFESPWDHLLLGPTEFLDRYSRKFDVEFAELLTYETFQSPQINRLFFEDYEYIFRANQLSTLAIRGLFKMNVEDTASTAIGRSYTYIKKRFSLSKYSDFLSAGVLIHQMKPS